MTQHLKQKLAAIMTGCAILLSIGNLIIVNALQPQNLNNAILHLVCCIIVAAAVYFCGIERILKSAPYLMGGLLLLLLICPVFAYNINGASRWLQVGSFRFAPAVLAMPILCLFWAYIKDKSANGVARKNCFLLAAVTLLAAGSVLIEPFYSMVGFIILLALIMFILDCRNRNKAVIAAAIVIIAGATLIPVAEKNFYSNLFTPNYDTQYHTWSLLATLKYSVFCGQHQVPEVPQYHIPNAITDSALIAGCGEFGYGFMIGALFLTAAIICCGIIITKHCKNPTARLLAGGMTSVIALPALTNMLMMFGLLPVGGVTFPFLAYGGCAMLANALALGCIIAISKKSNNYL